MMSITTCRATREEQEQSLSGDSIIPEPMRSITHAVTIDAPPASVWPWLAQMGGGRAGWYSYDWIDNGGHPSATTILPEQQRIEPGDIFPAVPGATDAFVVAKAGPPHDLILTGPDPSGGNLVSWEFFLKPLDAERTRLIVRVRVSSNWLAETGNAGASSHPLLVERIYGLLAKLPRPLMLGLGAFGHRLMEARMLRGVKRRAEGAYQLERRAF